MGRFLVGESVVTPAGSGKGIDTLADRVEVVLGKPWWQVALCDRDRIVVFAEREVLRA